MEKVLQGGMVKRARRSKRFLRRRPVWLLTAAALALACERPEYTYEPDLPLSDGSGANIPSVGGATSSGGSFTTAGTFGGTVAAGAGGGCSLDEPVASPTFSSQTVSNQLPARRYVYLQMTDEEVAKLKQTGELMPEPTQPPKASALTSLLTQLQSSASELRKPLLQELLRRFQVTRATWPNLWALRLVENPSSQHMNPVRLTLREDAWVVRISDGTPAIVDVNNAIVSISAATAEPERIAAIYYVVDDRSAGAIATCETGKRELALGNPSMVEELAIGTPDILAQLDSDIAALETLFGVVRGCASVDHGGSTFHAFTVCQSWRFFDASTEFLAYQWSLANPMEAYKPTSQNLATLIQALKDDRFEPDPFVAVPVLHGGDGGSAGEGGVGNSGGAGEGGAGNSGGAGEGGAPLGGAGGSP